MAIRWYSTYRKKSFYEIMELYLQKTKNTEKGKHARQHTIENAMGWKPRSTIQETDGNRIRNAITGTNQETIYDTGHPMKKGLETKK